MRVFLLCLMLWLSAAPAFAVTPDERLQDPAAEARARQLTKGLRCLVCQSESVDDSSAGFARDVRLLVREKISEGRTDDEIIAFLTARYGDFILMEPPVAPKTAALWLMPVVVFGCGIAAVFWMVRHKKA